MMQELISGGARFTLQAATRSTASQQELDAQAGAIFALFLAREREFGFNPQVVTEYPGIADPETSAFLRDPVAEIARRRTDLAAEGPAIARVVVLTTYADRIGAALTDAGFAAHPIDMPAGPDQTAAFTRDFSQAGTGRTLYLETVNEADEKIRPAFTITMRDAGGQLFGGACGSLHRRGGRLYAYLATMTLAAGLPPGTGTKLAGVMLDFLRAKGVGTVHLGTQTAGPFYEQLRFRITHRLIPALRNRQGADGSPVTHDLVMMKMDL